MRLLHLSDLHLGLRQYQRLTPAGINQREADIAASFARAVDHVISREPDLVVVAGDVFHQVRPPNPALVHAFSQVARMVRTLPHADVVMVAGNHDTPRSRDTVCILRLFAQLGVHVIDGAPRRVVLRDGAVSVLGVPPNPDPDADLSPEPGVRWNVLVLHGEIEGALPLPAGGDRPRPTIPLSVVANPDWDYVALGHYHVYRQVAERAWYSGALDYTNLNPWGELREERAVKLRGKGVIEFDLERGEQTFHPLPVSRPFIELPAIDGAGLGATELDARIAAAVEHERGGIDDRVVRILLRDVPRHVARDLDHRLLREYRRRALHFQLDVRPPEITRTSASGMPGRGTSLAETVRARLTERPLDSDLDRAQFVALGMRYLEQATSDAPATPPIAEAS